MLFYQKSIEESLAELNSRQEGLTDYEVTSNRGTHGLNAIHVKQNPWWRKILEPFMDVFMAVLAAAAIISFLRGEALDGSIILSIIMVSAIIYYAQQFSTERVLRSLNKQTIEEVAVYRNSQIVKVLSTYLVPGDIVTVTEGEKVPADIRLIKETNLRIDESVLTGESLPVDKNAKTLSGELQIYEQTNMLFSGSFVVGGTGVGVVTATGNNTEFGTIATLSQNTEAKSPVQLKIDDFIKKIVLIVLALAIVTFGLSLARGMDMSESLRFVIALSVSAIPEGLPIAISVALVLGMRRMATKRALVHQMRAIETLGVITTIATDKTGTLTENHLTVHETWHPEDIKNFDDIIGRSYNQASTADPFDLATIKYSEEHNALPTQKPDHELPFDQTESVSMTIWRNENNFDVYIKGAPEVILKHSRLNKSDLNEANTALEKLAQKGYRILAVATATLGRLPKEAKTVLTDSSFEFKGLIAAADTLRPEAPEAIRSAMKAGVTVRMITGDHVETAYQIGKDLGTVNGRGEVFDCRELNKLTDEQLDPIVKRTKIFARVIPEQKYRLLTILKKHHITAMTGDGVNDVPALTSAHVGIAMNSGSSIAKDASDIVLLDDNFKTIIDAMHEGRAIIANIRRMLFYLVSTNAGEVLVMIGALAIGTRPPLEAVQILWVNLVTDTSMVLPLGLEPAEKGIMKQNPLKPDAPILNRTMVIRTIIMALTIAGLTLVTFIFFSDKFGHQYAQTTAFIALVASQWGSAFAARSDHESIFKHLRVMNKSFYIGFIISFILQAIVLLTPAREIFRLTQVETSHLISLSLIGFVIPIVSSEIHKFLCWHTKTN